MESDQAVQADKVRAGEEKAAGGDAGGSSLQKTDEKTNFDKRLEGADTPEKLLQLTRELAEEPAKEEETKEKSEGAEAGEGREGEAGKEEDGEAKEGADAGGDAADGAEGKEDGGEGGEGKEEGSEEKAKEGEEGKEADESDKDEAEEADPDWAKKSQQFRGRIAKDDKVGALTIVIMKGNANRVKAGLKPLVLEEAIAQAKHELGLDRAKEADGKEGKEGQEKSDLPETLEATDALIKQLRTERSKAMTEELDLAKADQLDLKLDRLREHKFTLREQTATQEKEAVAEYNRRFDESKSAAAEAYDFVGDPESEAAKRMEEIDQEMEARSDPAFHDPNKPLIIAQMAAREFRIAPKKKAAGKKEGGEAKSGGEGGEKKTTTAPAGKKSVAASGASRTVEKTTQQGQKLAAIQAAKTPADLEKFGVGGM